MAVGKVIKASPMPAPATSLNRNARHHRHIAHDTEHTDSGKQFKSMIGSGGNKGTVDNVGLFRQIAGVSQHDGKGDRQAEENLPVSCYPYAGILQRVPIRLKHIFQSVNGSWQCNASDYQDQHKYEENQTDSACLFNSLADTLVHDKGRDCPDDDKGDDQAGLDSAQIQRAVLLPRFQPRMKMDPRPRLG